MKFIHRLGYYLGGFALGLVILAFFLSGKRTSCDYGPGDRVLKNIRNKEHAFSPDALEKIRQHQIDTTQISSILKHGSVDFKQSNTSLDSCKIYLIKGKGADQSLEFLIENCKDTAFFQEIKVMQ